MSKIFSFLEGINGKMVPPFYRIRPLDPPVVLLAAPLSPR